jgi:hypothetical protein
MDAKEFELPIEGSLGKLALFHSGQPKETKASFSSDKAVKKTKTVKKNNLPAAKKRK